MKYECINSSFPGSSFADYKDKVLNYLLNQGHLAIHHLPGGEIDKSGSAKGEFGMVLGENSYYAFYVKPEHCTCAGKRECGCERQIEVVVGDIKQEDLEKRVKELIERTPMHRNSSS